MSQVIKYNVFNPSNIHTDNVAKNKAGGNIVYLKYDENKKIILQTPVMVAPFGLSVYTDDNNSTTKYSIDLSFKNKDTDPKIATFHDTMQTLDKFMINKGVENSKEWFGKKMSKEVVEELYRPLIKESKDPDKYASTIKFKIRSSSDNFIMEAFDDNKNAFDMKNFSAGCKVRAIVELTSIWFVAKQFGCSLTILQTQISKPEKLVGFSFEPDSDDDDEDEEDDEEEEED